MKHSKSGVRLFVRSVHVRKRSRRDRITARILGIICLLLFCLAGVFLIITDRTGPVINLPGANMGANTDPNAASPAGANQMQDVEPMVYYDGMEKEELLQGVTAYDDKDGDVTDSLFVEDVFIAKGGSYAVISYAAMDGSRNVTRTDRKVEYGGKRKSEESPEDTGADEEGMEEPPPEEIKAGEPVSEPPSKDETEEMREASGGVSRKAEDSVTGSGTGDGQGNGTGSGMDGETDGGAEGQSEQAEKKRNPEAPVIKLNTDYVILKLGQKFRYRDYIEEVTDNKDDYETIWRRINVTGRCDRRKPGLYELTYFVVDTDRNISDKVILKVEYREQGWTD